MEWFEMLSQYEPANPSNMSFFDSIMDWTNKARAYIIFAELILVYYLGFATRIRMPILKAILLYVILFAGSLIFAILDVQLPVKAALFVAIVILVIVKLRIKPNSSSQGQEEM